MPCLGVTSVVRRHPKISAGVVGIGVCLAFAGLNHHEGGAVNPPAVEGTPTGSHQYLACGRLAVEQVNGHWVVRARASGEGSGGKLTLEYTAGYVGHTVVHGEAEGGRGAVDALLQSEQPPISVEGDIHNAKGIHAVCAPGHPA